MAEREGSGLRATQWAMVSGRETRGMLHLIMHSTHFINNFIVCVCVCVCVCVRACVCVCVRMCLCVYI